MNPNPNLREDDMDGPAAVVLVEALRYMAEVSAKQEAIVEDFKAKIPSLVSSEIDAAIRRLDNNEAPYGVLQKINAVAGKLEKNALVAHQRSLVALNEEIEREMPGMIDRALIKNSARIEAFLAQKLDEMIAQKVLIC